MVAKTSVENKNILVLFNIEFLEVLINELQTENIKIYYIADNDLEHLTAKNVFKVNSYILSDFTITELKTLVQSIDMKFDLVFSNPPYNSNIDIKILNEIIDIADEFVVVHPSTWLLDTKEVYSTYVNFKNKINRHIKSFTLFNLLE
jgi:tRNA1(Val) A37 N6-methylase TrmN6